MTTRTPLEDEPCNDRESKNDCVQTLFRSKTAKTLKGAQAIRFLNRITGLDCHGRQLLMARETAQFKFGNERAPTPNRSSD